MTVQIIPHPRFFIENDWLALIRSRAEAAEALGMLHPDQLTLIYKQKWFKALIPAEYGGLDLSLPGLVRLQEALSWADGSFGWVFTLCCGAGWFAGFIDTDLAAKLFADEKTCLAGSGASTGEATIVPGGYLISGQWNYASGAHHATHFTANCVIKNGDEKICDETGNPLILPFIVDRKDVELLPTWKYIGMVATGSHSFKIDNLKVDTLRCFKIDPASVTIEKRLYKYPFLQLAEATLAANLAGMSTHFVELAEEIIAQRIAMNKYAAKQEATLTNKLESIKTEMENMRARFYDAVDSSWRDGSAGLLEQVSISSRQLAKMVLGHVDSLYPYCGLQAASPETEINRVWRDVHTASQHSLLTFEFNS